MFTASISQVDYLGAALSHSAGGTLIYQPGLYGVQEGFGTIALSGSESAFVVASDCLEDRRFSLSAESVQAALALLNQGVCPLWLVESASGLQFAAGVESVPMGVDSAPLPRPLIQPLSSPLTTLVRKARNQGAPVLKIGMYSLQFTIGIGEWAIVEVLADSTWISIVQMGQLKSRREYPPMSAFELLKALDFDSLHF